MQVQWARRQHRQLAHRPAGRRSAASWECTGGAIHASGMPHQPHAPCTSSPPLQSPRGPTCVLCLLSTFLPRSTRS